MDNRQLQEILLASLSPHNDIRKHAEGVLASIEGNAGFLFSLLTLINDPTVQTGVRQSAAVFFKNLIKRRWNPEEDSEYARIIDSDREGVRTYLIDLLCSAPVDIQKQLSEAVAIIAKSDFPDNWQNLLPQLVGKLALNDIYVTKGVMITANSIMKRFRFANYSNAVNRDLFICLQQFQESLLATYKINGEFIAAAANDKDRLLVLMETHRLMSRIFFSLNWQEIPEYFEDHMAEWMTEFSKYLNYTNPLLIDPNETVEPGPVETLKAAIIENLNIYVSKYEEEFKDYLGPFTNTVWQLLLTVGAESKFDSLATCALKFLTSVSSKDMNKPLFTDEVLKAVIEQIVIRNVTATTFDEELFEDNPTDYIRKDMEGSDGDSRRRCAIELVRSLLKQFPAQITGLCVNYIGAMLEQYRAQMNWQAKDAALHLFLAVAVLSNSAAHGAVEINPNVNLVDIFTSHVVPEVNDGNVNARPIVKADAIKLLCMFRSQLPGPFLIGLLPNIIRHLSSESVVVQTYAAICVERFLTVKDKDHITGVMVPRITKENLMSQVNLLYTGLFTVLDNNDLPDNDYVMKCVMRTFTILEADILPVLPLLLTKLTQTLDRVCKNPINPHFNHYMFECIALLVRTACNPEQVAVAASCDQFEQCLFPPFQNILAQDVSEFIPYVFQVLALLLTARPERGGFSDAYKSLFVPLLSPVLWERKGNVPALTILFRAYIRTGFDQIVAMGKLEGVLGVFQKLLSLKATEQYAFQLIESLFAYGPLTTLRPYIPTIFNLFLMRMQEQMKQSQTPKFCRSFIHTMFYFAIVHGGKTLFEVLEAIGAGLSGNLVTSVMACNTSMCANLDKQSVGRIVLGGAGLLTESGIADNPVAWIALLKFVLTLASSALNIASVRDGGAAALAREALLLESEVEDEEAAARDFDSTYSKLAYVQIPDPVVGLDTNASIAAAFVNKLSHLFATRSVNAYADAVKLQLDVESRHTLLALLKMCEKDDLVRYFS
jgi:exportin-2 (importin alpha re-exporter)